ncbi:hypothetical protein PHLCEN_2v6531 [Hermanssonia centrifuga]|uniref:Uncharacterized protein n=1 Tax=Hermanssonia centrifuga TaxID=98765 RepID=A0A2R6NZD2_9APHY|nr:hypothetical protein PHLCEN_2v6531 [Hermanssonia centrifuga]
MSVPPTGPVEIVLPALDSTFGALLIGSTLGAAYVSSVFPCMLALLTLLRLGTRLWGVGTLQLYLYDIDSL